MSLSSSNTSIGPSDSNEEHDESPLGTPAELAGFFSRAPKRHKTLSIGIFVAAAIGGIAAAALIPRVFESTCKILVQKSAVTQMLSNPRGNVQAESAEEAIRSAPTIIMSRDNLLALVDELKLLDRWDSARPPALAWKDKVVALVQGPLPDDQKRGALVTILEKKIFVTADEGSTLRIRVEWQDAETSFALVSSIERRFLEAKSVAESSVTNDAIAILEEESKRAAEGINVALAELIKAREKAAPSPAPRPAAKTSYIAPLPASSAPNVDVAVQLAEKRAAIRDIRDPWQKQLADLKAQMNTLRVTYAEGHPQVVALQNQINEASIKPLELTTLENQERELLAELSQPRAAPSATAPPRPAQASQPPAPTTPSPSGPGGATFPWAGVRVDEPPEVAAAHEKLVAATSKYADVVDRLDGARVQLASVQAAFKYRFKIVQPPEVPRRALRPNRPFLVASGLLGGLILGLLAGGIRDLLGGRFIEAWQVPRRLKLPLLAEVDVSDESGHDP
jgi:uncharacterized protein involved in exopolysaccharide biosynthesis